MSKNCANWEQAKRLVLRAKPYWATFSNSTYIKDLAIGNIWAAHGYSSDMFRAQQDALAAGCPFTAGFSTPSAVPALDNFVLHQSGKRPDLAHRFIDFMLDGENAADASNLIGATAQDAGRLEMLRDFDAKSRRILSRMWTEIKVR